MSLGLAPASLAHPSEDAVGLSVAEVAADADGIDTDPFYKACDHGAEAFARAVAMVFEVVGIEGESEQAAVVFQGSQDFVRDAARRLVPKGRDGVRDGDGAFGAGERVKAGSFACVRQVDNDPCAVHFSDGLLP